MYGGTGTADRRNPPKLHMPVGQYAVALAVHISSMTSHFHLLGCSPTHFGGWLIFTNINDINHRPAVPASVRQQ